jgi:hypothetical protein
LRLAKKFLIFALWIEQALRFQFPERINTFFLSGGAELLDSVQELWESLNLHHASVSPHLSGAVSIGFVRKAQKGSFDRSCAKSPI